MTSPTHILIGLSTTIAFSRLNGIAPTVAQLLIMLLGSLLPDIDVDGAAITRPGGIFRRFMPWSVAHMLDGIGSIISNLLNALFGHRGFLHAPAIGLGLIGYGAVAHLPYLFWLGWGYFWHIIGDVLTYGGVPLLSPVSSREYSLKLCKTNSLKELFFATVLLLYVIVFGYQLLPDERKAGFKSILHKLYDERASIYH